MDLKKLISREADKINSVIKNDIGQAVSACDPLLAEILEYALLGGGKRVRPLLVVLSGRICGRDDDNLYRLAAAFEYLHVATLLHDDVIDQADTRRGQVAVNRKFGLIGAILAGDFLHAYSMEIVAKLGGDQAVTPFTNATRGMVDGEYIQLRNSSNYNQSENDYYSVIMGKTALLIGAACEVGAMYGGADDRKRVVLADYGIKLGCAFQIVDDLLDYQGQSDKTGKVVGNDLAEGKMTLPLIIAMQQAEPGDRKRLQTILHDEDMRNLHFEEVYKLINKYSGFDEARVKAERMVDEAEDGLDSLVDDQNRASVDILHGLARYVLSRQK